MSSTMIARMNVRIEIVFDPAKPVVRVNPAQLLRDRSRSCDLPSRCPDAWRPHRRVIQSGLRHAFRCQPSSNRE
jgi:hypothetical protein